MFEDHRHWEHASVFADTRSSLAHTYNFALADAVGRASVTLFKQLHGHVRNPGCLLTSITSQRWILQWSGASALRLVPAGLDGRIHGFPMLALLLLTDEIHAGERVFLIHKLCYRGNRPLRRHRLSG